MGDELEVGNKDTDNQSSVSRGEIRDYLSSLEEHLDKRKGDLRVMRWTGIGMVIAGIVLVALTSQRMFGRNWWISALVIAALGIASTVFGRRLGRRMAEKEFGPHEQVLKRLIAEAEKRKSEQDALD